MKLVLVATLVTMVGTFSFAFGRHLSSEDYQFGVRVGYVCGADRNISCFNAASSSMPK